MKLRAKFPFFAAVLLLAAPAFADDAIVAAKVNGTAITKAEVEAQVKELPPQIQQLPFETIYPQVLEQMIVERIIRDQGMKAGLADDAEVAKRMADAKEKIVADEYLRREVKKYITDAKLQKAYADYAKDFKGTEQVRASHILVKTEDEAKAVIKQIEGGADFTKIATDKSLDKGAAARGGDLGYFGKGQMVEEFETATFAMKPGDVSKTPVKTDFGFHVIKLVDKRTTSPESFESMKPQLEMQLSQEAAKTIVKRMVQKTPIERFGLDGKPLKAPK